MRKLPTNNPILSVVVLNYNSAEYLPKCLLSIDKSALTDYIEVIIADNASTDNSFTSSQKLNLSNKRINYIFHKNTGNVGFSTGNNQGLSVTNPNSELVLFLNPDTTVEINTLQGMISYLHQNPQIDAATCYITLALTGQLQPDCHRGFPTPWNTFWHFFGFGLPQLFPKSKIFNGYLLGYLDYSKIQLIDCCVGAFFILKRQVGDTVGWWNEKYFMYGEDLDFCYKLKQDGFKLYFIPDYKIIHYQGVSSGLKKSKSSASRETKVRSAKATTNAMKIFYQENLLNNYPQIIHPIIYLGIKMLETYRIFKAKYL